MINIILAKSPAAVEKLKNLQVALADLEGVEIPYNIIRQLLEPLDKWLTEYLQEARK